jgi:hypothetical protein
LFKKLSQLKGGNKMESYVKNDSITLRNSRFHITAKKPYITKRVLGWKLYVNYGQGWEYEIFEETRKGYQENRKAYNENCQYAHYWKRGYETIEVYPNDTL